MAKKKFIYLLSTLVFLTILSACNKTLSEPVVVRLYDSSKPKVRLINEIVKFVICHGYD